LHYYGQKAIAQLAHAKNDILPLNCRKRNVGWAAVEQNLRKIPYDQVMFNITEKEKKSFYGR